MMLSISAFAFIFFFFFFSLFFCATDADADMLFSPMPPMLIAFIFAFFAAIRFV